MANPPYTTNSYTIYLSNYPHLCPQPICILTRRKLDSDEVSLLLSNKHTDYQSSFVLPTSSASSLVFSKEYSHLSWHHKHPDDKGNTAHSPSYKLSYRDCLSSPQGQGGTVHRLSSAHVNFMTSMDVLSVTCFAQMKYACILFIPHPTGGLRLIDSRLCSLLTISFDSSM
jgi:hypothetical protein